jgi:hypothetical protein
MLQKRLEEAYILWQGQEGSVGTHLYILQAAPEGAADHRFHCNPASHTAASDMPPALQTPHPAPRESTLQS